MTYWFHVVEFHECRDVLVGSPVLDVGECRDVLVGRPVLDVGM